MAAKKIAADLLLESFPGSAIEDGPADYLDAARDYLARGWSVIPVDPATKRPMIRWEEFQRRHPTDTELVRWFAPPPKGLRCEGIGIVCGPVSQLLVIDADGEEGEANALALGAEQRPTYTVMTPRGGRHWYYQDPGGVSSVNGKLAPHVDRKCSGGYVVCPPSSGYRVVDDSQPAHAPGWARKDWRENKTEPAHPAISAVNGERGGTRYGEVALGKEVAALTLTATGGRNEQLNRTAFALGQLVAGGELDEEHVRGELFRAAQAIGLTEDVNSDERQVLATIDSGMRAGMAEPRSAPASQLRLPLPEFADDDEEPEAPAPVDPAIPSSGFVAHLVDHLCSNSMIAPEFALTVALTNVAAVGQAGRVWEIGSSEWGTALWFLCVAQAGQKKSSAFAGLQPLERLMRPHRLEASVTSETLSQAFGEKRDRWAAHTEFGSFMAETEKQYMLGVRDAFTALWDGNRMQSGDRRRVGQGRSEVPPYSTLTLIGMATESHFAEWAADRAIEQGFLTRFIIIPQANRMAYAGLGAGGRNRRLRIPALAEELERIRRLANSIPWVGGEPALVEFSPEAANALNAYDEPWATREDLAPCLSGFGARLGPNAMRLATNYALAESRLIVEEGDAQKSIALMEYGRTRSWPLIERYFAASTFQGKNLARLEAAMDRLSKRSSDEGWVTERQLHKSIRLYGRPYEEAVKYLVDVGSWEWAPGRYQGTRRFRRRQRYLGEGTQDA